ncbi:hypothetical protein AGDE_14600 [Angomonas deanei]|uniref:Uncharacterized protein n=1 Tax=Angomonas deanei TaxID=59799 RepID=A0A7G2CQK7_9TRYP|nr:hypothetical protein AGDE_14600 [Angomonas deanei]CAD2222060.1 hypothetical protein, conserved [Angomonas deanei]|eukprot:EPY20566.1 hypothetical protein AGDE_14600 [Angomonas deanei]
MKRSSPSTRTARGVGGLRKKSVTISPGVLGPTIVELLSKAAVPGGVYAFIGERLEKPIAGEGIGCMFVSREVAPSRSGSLVSRIGKSSSSGVPQVFLALNSTPPDPSLLELTLEGETNTGHDEDGSSSTDYSCPHTPLLTPPEAPWVLQETDECAIRWEEGTTPLIPVAALGDAIFFCVSVFDLIKGQWGFLSLLFPPFMLGGTEKEKCPSR